MNLLNKLFGSEKPSNVVFYNAIKDRNLEKIQKLLKQDSAPILSNIDDGWSPLQIAIGNCSSDKDLEMVKLLLANININATDQKGWTALHMAISNGQKQIAELLLKKGANINARTNSGTTPLHLAAIGGVKGYPGAIIWLLANKAEVNAKNNEGMTPLNLAEERRYKETADLLRQHGGQEASPCQECGAPLSSRVAERGVEYVTTGGLCGGFSCNNCSRRVHVPLKNISTSKGVNVICPHCHRMWFVPASVWCKKCGQSLSTGWQKMVKPG